MQLPLHTASESMDPGPNLSAEHRDWLAEVGSIGAGRAASRLSDLIGRRCLISVPRVVAGDTPSLHKTFDQDEVLAVAGSMQVVGEIPARVIVLLRRSHAHLLLHYMTRQPRGRGGRLDFTSQFAIRRLTDALTVSFCGNVYRFLRAKPWYGMPEMISGPWSATLRSKLQAFANRQGPHLVIHANFYDEEGTFTGTFLFLLDSAAQHKAINRIRLLLES